MYVGNAALFVFAVGIEVRLSVVHVQKVVELLRDDGAPVLVAHLRWRTLDTRGRGRGQND